MDIVIRVGRGMGGTRQEIQNAIQANGEVHFYRGARPQHCVQGERAYFLEQGHLHGYAEFHCYAWRQAQPGSGRPSGNAIVVHPPYTPIEPPLPVPAECNRRLRLWRYIQTCDGLVELLRSHEL